MVILKHLNKALLISVAVASVLAARPVDVWAQNDDVANTKHNLSELSGGNDPTSGTSLVDYGEICVYCHTPHGGDIDAPLWNRNFSSSTYQMYSSSTIDMTIDTQPTGISMACLGCHDGTIGLDVVLNPPNSWGEPTSVPGTTPGVNTMPDGPRLLDTDLRNDHPVSVAYDPAQDPMFNSAASIKSAGLRLFTDPSAPGVEKVQCASCHNPHNDTFSPLLRISNSGSDLCKTCHIK